MFRETKGKERGIVWRVAGELGSETFVCDRRDKWSVVLRRKAYLSGKGLEVKSGDNECVLHYSAKPKTGIVVWKDQKGDVVALATPAVHRETEAEKMDIFVEIVKENIDLLVDRWIARILQDMQKEGEKGTKEEQWTSALLKGNRMGSFMGVGSSRRTKNL
jgi:hypothetical protein